MIQTVKVKTDTNTKVIFNKAGCSDVSGSAGMGFPYQRVSQCEEDEWEDCKKQDSSTWDVKCDTARERFSDDCEGFTNLEECDKWYSQNPPICDENTPLGTTCIDEGDPDTCEPGFVDRGFGCEPEEQEQEEVEETEEEESEGENNNEEELFGQDEEDESESEDDNNDSEDESQFG